MKTRYTVHSFDVFDTCLYRYTVSPASIFYLLANELVINGILNNDDCDIYEFVKRRQDSEKKALVHERKEEVSLEEIWIQMKLFYPHIDEKYCIEKEKETERRHIRPNIEILHKIQDLRKSGIKVLFISDTYFDTDFLYLLLHEHGFTQSIDEVFCSSKYLVTKSTGRLFHFISNKEKLNYKNWVHYGDNLMSDIHIPRKIGIKCVHITDTSLNYFERELSKSCYTSNSMILAIRDFRLGRIRLDDYSMLAGQFLGPFLVVWGLYVLKTAVDNNIERLYFASRDCRLLFEVCKKLNDHYQFGLTCQYLYISRKAITIASLRSLDVDNLDWTFSNYQKHTVEILINKINIEYSLFAEAAKDFNCSWSKDYIIKERDIELFKKIISSNKIKTVLDNYLKFQNLYCVKYFNSIGLNDNKAALVDIGWRKTAQLSINKVLSLETVDNMVQGIYLGVHSNSFDKQISGNSFSMFYPPSNTFESFIASPVYDNVTLLEHVLGVSDHNTVLGYDLVNDSVVPKYVPVSHMWVECFSKLKESVLLFTNNALENNLDVDHDEENAKHFISSLIQVFLKCPTRSIVQELSAMNVSIHEGDLHSQGIIGSGYINWPIGNAVNSKWYRLLFAMVTQRLMGIRSQHRYIVNN